MPVTAEKVRQLELELAEARSQLLQEDGKRFQIVMREISEEEKQRILESMTDRQERILFGLEAPERGAVRAGKSGGDLECPICHKKGLTARGLHLHTVRTHKGEKVPETGDRQGVVEPEETRVGSSPRRRQGRGEPSAERT